MFDNEGTYLLHVNTGIMIRLAVFDDKISENSHWTNLKR